MALSTSPLSFVQAGPGAVVDRDLSKPMRSHHDLRKGNAPFYKGAKEFYNNLAARCLQSSHIIDCFTCSMDQVWGVTQPYQHAQCHTHTHALLVHSQTGLLEMRTCVTATGGLVVLADSFKQSVFKESFKRMFKRHDASAPASDAGHLAMGFNGTMEVLTSREYKVYAATPPTTTTTPTVASPS